MLRIGNCEAEVKVGAVMSCPRLGFTDNFFCIAQALAPHGISPIKVSGAFWGMCLQRGMESLVEDHDFILTFDYDTIFTAKTVEALLTLLMHSGMDAIAPLQTKRESNCVMFSVPDASPEEKIEVQAKWFGKAVQPAETAHFGCTFLRTSALKKVKKPWFQGSANDKGEFDGGHCDEDIHFWREWKKAGNTLGIATHVSVGHAELMITWPSREAESGKIQQHTTDFWSDKKPPDGVWGYIA